jgi:hypothetical protein
MTAIPAVPANGTASYQLTTNHMKLIPNLTYLAFGILLGACAQTPKHTSRRLETPVAIEAPTPEPQPTPIPDSGYDKFGRPFHFTEYASQEERREMLWEGENNPMLVPGGVIPTAPSSTVTVRVIQ